MARLFLFGVSVLCLKYAASMTMDDMESLHIYYDDAGQPVPMLTNVSDVVPTLKTPSVRFGPLPCECADLKCGCCVNMNIQLFNFTRRGCTNFTYDPYEFSIRMNMLWNEQSIFNRSISGKNPPPACAQLPLPGPYFPTMDQCVRLFNIFTPGRNIHMCMNLETRIERVPVLVLQFDCMKMGLDGVSLLKPEDEGGVMPQEMEEGAAVEGNSPTDGRPSLTTQEASDVFDPVDPEKKKFNITITDEKNTTTQATPMSIDIPIDITNLTGSVPENTMLRGKSNIAMIKYSM
ncbi:uncharacterized protein LOC128997598 [Macrosteles quadrilineatus]|uniref:uncharacterized protein LOC128997598 n=1 Tax=Macrosteles quadrilineatus TaxID=74068 RepID=UPI0023E0D033|nr:uncharacterized protein LOC128997598 [Macrosteles quadrilineatus]